MTLCRYHRREGGALNSWDLAKRARIGSEDFAGSNCLMCDRIITVLFVVSIVIQWCSMNDK